MLTSGAERDADVDPLDLYAEGLDGSAVYLRHADGRRELLPTRRWTAGLQPGDESLLARCIGPTLDIGCGPGRLVRALGERGGSALGIDVSSTALALARATGAPVLQRDVFGDVPRIGRWSRLLLADGNIGIGGDPVRLLARCRTLLSPRGLVLAELSGAAPVPPATAAPAAAGPRRSVRLESTSGQVSAWFPWAVVDLGEVRRAAVAAGLRVVAVWQEAGRPFVALGLRRDEPCRDGLWDDLPS
jgi:SAM-dependent methyltransferase